MSKRAPKPTVIQYGIVITKPWSNEMYEHNEFVAAKVRDEVLETARNLYANVDLYKLGILQKIISYYSLDEYTDQHRIYRDIVDNCSVLENFSIHDIMDELAKNHFISPIAVRMIGYDKNPESNDFPPVIDLTIDEKNKELARKCGELIEKQNELIKLYSNNFGVRETYHERCVIGELQSTLYHRIKEAGHEHSWRSLL